MNYFEFYNIPLSFKVDEAALKSVYYANSKQYHPDFYTLESEEKQAEILELSTLNNKAYHTLSDFDKRMKYLLDLKGVLADEGQNKIPQSFLIEMMDINEALMELEFDFDKSAFDKLSLTLKKMEDELFEEVQSVIQDFDYQNASETDWGNVKAYYLKKRYLLRLREQMTKYQ